MHWRQVVIVALCIALNALDGFDVLAISFASPGIAAEWGIDKAALGVVLSMELFGMAAGSALIGNVADRIGRRPVILGCLIVMMAGMFGAATATGVTWLSIARLVTGLGIGGMLSSTSALVAEFSNTRRQGLNVSLNIAGYSTGAILGGLVASALLAGVGDWRWVFAFGGVATAVALPLAWLFLPESIDSLAMRRRDDAVRRINATLGKLGHPPIDALPVIEAPTARPSIGTLFTSGYAVVTLLLTVAYFAQIMLFYFVVKWIPKIVVDMGYSAAQAGHVLVAANVGNLTGAVLIGLAVQRWPARPLVTGAMIAGFVAICVFGLGFHDLTRMSITAGIAAFFINVGVVGLYPILARAYPASLRATGTGFVIGLGRGGSALGPMAVGALFESGRGLLLVSFVMGLSGLVAATMLILLPLARSGGAEGLQPRHDPA
ncbi:MFS transporter [Sphingomonas oryzagri]|uniref:MFS transporter n=1 Tax=Sphingomonas oryzagri TaxID=3042314 RepID=A0ABT6MXB6_9SPHN|nr:MFS transporter [Sphingomonas oryzagri]MDH7637690.1 MFS transporter [Sphingomonas oryzagri]